MYAIIRTGGRQYRVREGDRIDVGRLTHDEGAEVTLEDVLLVDNDGNVRVGAPVVDGATVRARVQEHALAPKVTAFKYKNKTRYRRLKGHRQPITRLEITSISAG